MNNYFKTKVKTKKNSMQNKDIESLGGNLKQTRGKIKEQHKIYLQIVIYENLNFLL